MATIFWVGGTSTAWDTAANWSGGAVPSNSDTVVFTDSRITVNQNVAGATTTNVPLNIYLDPSYEGNLGSSGTYLTFDASNITQVYIAGTGKQYLNIASGDTITEMIVLTDNKASDAVNIDADGTLTNLFVLKGQVNVVSGANVTTMNIAYESSKTGDATVNIQAAAAVTTVNQAAGVLNSAEAVTTLNMEGGAATWTDGNITTVNIHGGGTLVYKSDTHTITALNVFNGFCDLSQEGSPKTITNCNIYNQGTVDTRSGAAAATLTFTNAARKFGPGASLLQSGSAFSPKEY